MQTRRRRSRRSKSGGENKAKYIRVAAIPIVLAASAAAVFVFTSGHTPKDSDSQDEEIIAASSPQQSEKDIAGEEISGFTPDNNQYTTDYSDYELQKDAVPQVNALISAYFQAKVDKDAAALYKLFGKEEDDRLSQRQEELENEAVYTEDYQGITCYTRPGITEDSYVVYVTYDVKFRRVDTLAPGLMWCYVVKNEDGDYIIRENVIGEEADYVARQNQTEDVRLLSSQVNARLKEAVESDTLLASIYKELSNGAIVAQAKEEESQDSQIELIDDTQPETYAQSTPEENTPIAQETLPETEQPEPEADTQGEEGPADASEAPDEAPILLEADEDELTVQDEGAQDEVLVTFE